MTQTKDAANTEQAEWHPDPALNAVMHRWLGERHSPEHRLEDYHRQIELTRAMRILHCINVAVYFLCAAVVIEHGLVVSREWIILSVTLSWLVSGDVYELVRDRIEQRVFCPRYDGASQPRPKFEVGAGLGWLRFFIYLPIAMLLPVAMLMVFSHYELFSMKPILNPCVAAVVVGLLAVFKLNESAFPTSARAILQPFRPVPRPDVHSESGGWHRLRLVIRPVLNLRSLKRARRS